MSRRSWWHAVLTARTPGVSVELERFDRYWGGAPALRRIHILPVAWGSVEARRQVPTGAPVTFYAVPGTPEFERASREHVLHERPGLPVQYLGFDLRPRDSPGVRLPAGEHGNPFLDPRVRSAIALAIDYERLLSSVLAGKTRPASQVVPPQAVGFDPGLPEPRRDLAEAHRLMALSAFPRRFEVDLDAREFVGEYFVPHLVEGLRQIGIRARVHTFADQEFFDHLRSGRSSLFLLRYSCRTGDAQEFFDKIIHSRDEARGYGVFNFSYDRSPTPELDLRIEEARRTIDPQRRLARLQEVMRRVIGERLVVPLLSERSITFLPRGLAWTPRADGFRMFAEMRPEAR
jgi:peptide/nickel transport system substrate-binding protein